MWRWLSRRHTPERGEDPTHFRPRYFFALLMGPSGPLSFAVGDRSNAFLKYSTADSSADFVLLLDEARGVVCLLLTGFPGLLPQNTNFVDRPVLAVPSDEGNDGDDSGDADNCEHRAGTHAAYCQSHEGDCGHSSVEIDRIDGVAAHVFVAVAAAPGDRVHLEEPARGRVVQADANEGQAAGVSVERCLAPSQS